MAKRPRKVMPKVEKKHPPKRRGRIYQRLKAIGIFILALILIAAIVLRLREVYRYIKGKPVHSHHSHG